MSNYFNAQTDTNLQKIKSAVSSKSKQSTKTNKTINPKQGIIPNKNNPGYLYLMEIERNKKKKKSHCKN
jgi:hypothetical protein